MSHHRLSPATPELAPPRAPPRAPLREHELGQRPSGVSLRPLQLAELPEAAALITAALPWDHGAVVAEEKLFGGNGPRSGQTTGAFTAAGELVGLLAQAGRFVKLLAVHPDAQRRGIGTALLAAARTALATADGPPPRLRIGDHAGNYLAPGVDERYLAGHAFFRARGLVEVGRNLNLRAPLVDNPLCSRARCQELQAAATGYTLRRATAPDVPALLACVESAFAPLWAYEVARALGPGLGGPAAAHTPQLPEGAAVHLALDKSSAVVAFAAHDGNNRGLGWFGPMGTLPAHRGHGLGEALLLACLADVAAVAAVRDRPDAGVIAWVGPAAFYARACGAAPDRRFVVYQEP